MKQNWDAVVIGTGFGGSAVAFKLAKAGLSVLLLERGPWVERDQTAWDPLAIHVRGKYRGGSPQEVDERRGRKLVYPNHAVGGASVFYGGASFRLRTEDFAPSAQFNQTDHGSPPRMDWPIRYEDLAPWYDEAELTIGVAGVDGSDPTEPPRSGPYPEPPPPFGSSARRLADAARNLGLRPFPIPLAINFNGRRQRPRCVMCMTCDLFPCRISAKNDLAVTLLPEVSRCGGEIRDRTVAKCLLVDGNRVRGIECLSLRTGDTYTVRCDLCVVSGGAIASAALLLRSGLDRVEPHGRLVGRYLMRHCSGIVIGIFPFKTNPERQFHKQVAITDFYFGQPGRRPQGPWGMMQALQTPPPELIEHTAPYPLPARWCGVKTLPYQAYLLCLAQDLANWENRVDLHPQARDRYGMPVVRVFHKYSRRDLRARQALYREARRILRKAGALVQFRSPVHTYSHAMGTCRFGTSPAYAVLDSWCRFFGIPNLFVVDGSFMPSSGGVNPSLTIAANGLRVGQYIAEQWDEVVQHRER
ncbi:MAG: FAD-binding protein [Gemmatimonadales bacterium]|nr:FAD-binding protein [Gemmatimonadales bacterium]NIN13374.1 FAD-binding protein [Gemmatimonadales bacterium]NIN51377.1 FAD-binding protein [Gemmatimonadales bacterium]NIP08841.1 FAD-binding protein [Gemmatimonadales bacterium]NIQ99835.1 FAD-binding protein [Gemmatimonadales bacterium]